MNRVKWERFKFYTLIALILTSLLQAGILWSNQNHGFPYYFFGNLLKNKESLNDSVDKYFYPYKIIVSEGQDESHWIIDKDNLLHNKLFNEVKLYLVEILRMDRIKSKQVMSLDEIKLGELASKYSVSVEFKTGISRELMAFFLDIKDISNEEISTLKKVVILPGVDANSNCTIDIIDETNKKIYEYVLPFQKLGIEDYKKQIGELSANENLIDYGLINELLIPKDKSKGLQIGNDILFVASHSNKYKTYSTIDCYPPKEFEVKDTQDLDELKQELVNLARVVLMDQKDIYIPSKDIYGAAVFKNPDSAYRIYKDGLMEYSYFPPSKEEMDKGNVQDAYIRTLGFINNKERLVNGATLFLSGVEELKDRYLFKFDYTVENLPMYMSYQANDKEKRLLKNAITVEATGDRVLNCWWIFKEFKKQYDNQYNIFLEELLNNLHDQYSKQDKAGSLNIKNIEVGYKVTREDFLNIEPVWILETMGTDDPYTVTMRKK